MAEKGYQVMGTAPAGEGPILTAAGCGMLMGERSE